MRPVFRTEILMLISFTTLLLACLSFQASATPSTGAQAADHSFVAAISKSDSGSIGKLLDPEFTWTDRMGKTHSKEEVLSTLSSLASDTDTGVEMMESGQVVLIHGSHSLSTQNAAVRFVRFWVKRPRSWQLLAYQETYKTDKNPEKRSGFGAPSNGGPVTCENPCKTIPYKPESSAEQDVATMWQAVERTVLTNGVEAWAPNFTEDFLFVTPDGGTPRMRWYNAPCDTRVPKPSESTHSV